MCDSWSRSHDPTPYPIRGRRCLAKPLGSTPHGTEVVRPGQSYSGATSHYSSAAFAPTGFTPRKALRYLGLVPYSSTTSPRKRRNGSFRGDKRTQIWSRFIRKFEKGAWLEQIPLIPWKGQKLVLTYLSLSFPHTLLACACGRW